MFTGIITEIGEVKSIVKKGVSTLLEVKCSKTADNIALGDSVAVNGVCLSVVKMNGALSFDVVGNTFNKTNLKRLKTKDRVNLENALKLGDTLSGHMVSGHIDCERPIRASKKTSKGWALDIGILPGDEKHIVPRGSVAVDGISLTVGEISSKSIRIFVIPHTLENTILNLKRTGDYVNLEFDMMAKYAEKKNPESSISQNMLREKGFM
jgi:riboflavin synthase